MYGYCFYDGYACISAKKLRKEKVAALERQHGGLVACKKI